MPKSYRIRTEIGKDKAIHVNLEQDFEYLEILSLKILQSDIYTRVCSDYGVVVGRITANNGTGLPNCKVSIFIPLSQEDEENAIISELYPYKTLNDTNDEGYRYNLLPYTKSHGGHTPTGTFPTRNDILINQTLIEVYDKYYKFTVKTNDSGDFMIFGVPLGTQTIHVDVDLSDIGEFSMTPQDLIRIGLATPNQISGTQFRSSSNLGELPQLLQFNRIIEVFPLWGQPEVCTLGITRTDFDLTEEAGITIQPAAVFMGSIFSNQDKRAIKRRCRVNRKLGNLCQLTTGPGEILAIRQTIGLDSSGLPVLEEYFLDEGGKVIDENGTWLIDVPMNLEFIYTNEFGERTISTDPKIGVPTKAKYRFKIKWEQPATLGNKITRASFLVPNVKEWGWSSSGADPYIDPTDNESSSDKPSLFCRPPVMSLLSNPSFQQIAASYAFSLNWSDYGTIDMIQEAINCEDRFYEFNYNKVYTVAELISEYRSNSGNKKFMAIRDVLDDTCESTNNPFPVNDAQFQFDILYLLFSIVALIVKPILILLLFVTHLFAWVICKIKDLICGIKNFVCSVKILRGRCREWKDKCNDWRDKCEGTEINLPLLTYPDCELCECTSDPVPTQTTGSLSAPTIPADQDLYPPTVFLSINPETTITYPNLLPLLNFQSPSNQICYPPTSTATVPATNKRTFTMSLPYNEKINLFNTKAKYFDQQVVSTETIPRNPGGGVNRIKVWFNISDTGNDPNSAYHYDNVFAMILPPIPPVSASSVGGDYTELTFGDLVRFSADAPPTDRNMTYYTGSTTGYNPFGNRAITGVTGGTTFVSPGSGWGTLVEHPDQARDENDEIISGYTFNRTLTYANYAANSTSAQPPQLSTNYKIFISERDTKNQRFGFDDEYFQVIYTGTVSNFLSSALPSNSAPNSFARRFLNGSMRFITNTYDGTFQPPTYDDPDLCNMSQPPGANPLVNTLRLTNQTYQDLQYRDVIPNFDNYRVVFMVRGVDPHSTKVKCRYDLAALFGYNLSPGSGISPYSYEFMAHMNIPIQPSIRATRHSLTDSTQVDSYSNNNLYFDTFGFTPDPTQYINFYSQKPYNYSSLDGSSFGGAPATAYEVATSANFAGISDDVLVVDSNNDHTKELWASTVSNLGGDDFIPSYNTTLPAAPPSSPYIGSETNLYNDYRTGANNRNRGYYLGEVVEGGSLLHIPRSTNPFTWVFDNGSSALNAVPISQLLFTNVGMISPNTVSPGIPQHFYFGQKYSYGPGMEIKTGASGRQLVMRSDRLPTSDKPTNTNSNSSLNGGSAPGTSTVANGVGTANSVLGFSNPLFNVTVLDPAGEGSTVIIPSPSINAGDNQENQADIGSVGQLSAIAGSFTCDGIKPLDCYQVLGDGSVVVLGNGDECNTNNCCNDDDKTKCEDCNGEQIVEFGCYKLVTDPWKSRRLDKYLINEWLLRMRISFAACRNVWGHMFTNQWVNGTLFFYPLQVRTLYTSPGTPIPTPGSNDLGPNQPFSCFCNHLAYFDFKTNNFYYRSAPYNDTSGFIGRNGLGFKGNVKLLGNPTTIMDLGPVNDYMDELSYSEDFLGYVVDRLESTSFQDVDELLNLFIIQRLVSASIRNIIRSSAKLGLNNDPVRRYFSRDNNKVDGDYAQMIAINSQIGVIQFDTSTYQDPVDIYFGSAGVDSSVFGVFFSADTQIRDWLSPKRTIVTPGGDPSDLSTSNCAFDNFPIFSQEIPMYLWQIKPNNPDVIFGAQKNEWFTNTVTSTFNYIPYQSIDRLDGNSPIGSRTMIPHQTDNESYYLGYIHNTVSDVTASAQGAMGTQGPDGPIDRRVNNTAPFYFYFGLVKGSSAFDRFLTKWVKKDTNTF